MERAVKSKMLAHYFNVVLPSYYTPSQFAMFAVLLLILNLLARYLMSVRRRDRRIDKHFRDRHGKGY